MTDKRGSVALSCTCVLKLNIADDERWKVASCCTFHSPLAGADKRGSMTLRFTHKLTRAFVSSQRYWRPGRLLVVEPFVHLWRTRSARHDVYGGRWVDVGRDAFALDVCGVVGVEWACKDSQLAWLATATTKAKDSTKLWRSRQSTCAALDQQINHARKTTRGCEPCRVGTCARRSARGR